MPVENKKESIKDKIARLEKWTQEMNEDSEQTIRELFGRGPQTSDSGAKRTDIRQEAQQAIIQATEDSAKVDEEARKRLRQVKRKY